VVEILQESEEEVEVVAHILILVKLLIILFFMVMGIFLVVMKIIIHLKLLVLESGTNKEALLELVEWVQSPLRGLETMVQLESYDPDIIKQ
jgi:hypothetical protein